MVNLFSPTLTTLACLLALTTASPLLTETKGKYTVYRRQSSTTYSWPFPGNRSSIVDEASEPKDNPPQDLQVTAEPVGAAHKIPRKFIETKCDAGKKFKITEAWKEAKLLASAQTTFNLGYNYNIPHTQWLGKDWNSESSWRPWRWNYRKLIMDNFGRLSRLYGNNAPESEYIYWYCYDYGSSCLEGVQAYSWDSPGFFWSNHYVVFCDPFYNRMTLGEQISQHANNKHEQKVMENFQLNRGQIMFHETWHFKNLVSSPRAMDYVYRAQGAWELARDYGTNWAYVNADSYAMDAVAIYVQQHYKSSMSPVPWRMLNQYDSEAAGATSEPLADNARMKTFTEKPQLWNGTVPNTDSPDPAEWEEVEDDPPASPPPPTGNESRWPIRTCGTSKMTREDAGLAINKTCTSEDIGSLRAAKKIFGPDDKSAYSQDVHGTYNPKSPYMMHVEIQFMDEKGGCGKLNFGNDKEVAGETCKKMLGEAVNGCGDFKKTEDLWKTGGTFDDGCMKWSLMLK